MHYKLQACGCGGTDHLAIVNGDNEVIGKLLGDVDCGEFQMRTLIRVDQDPSLCKVITDQVELILRMFDLIAPIEIEEQKSDIEAFEKALDRIKLADN